jgi:hypothetical protein
MGMVLEDSIEVMRGSTYEQVESEREDRGSKGKDRCPLTAAKAIETTALTVKTAVMKVNAAAT